MYRLRRLLPYVLIPIAIASVIYLALSGSTDPRLIFATAIMGLLGIAEPVLTLIDRYVPDRKPEKPGVTGTVESYLQGQLEAFGKEQAVFVHLSADAIIETRFSDEKRHETYDTIKQVTDQHDRFVLVGDPGAGKSTTLKHLWSEAARSAAKTKRIPLFIHLGLSDNPIPIAELLDFWWSRHGLPGSPEVQLNNHQLLLYLDGLNEMPDASRKERSAALRSWLEQYPDVPVIVTCRARDYADDSDLNLDLQIVKVLHLDEQHTKEFIQKRTKSLALWEQIKGNEARRRMAENPYNLTMLIEIYQARQGKLPEDLNQLYAMYVQTRHEVYHKEHKVRLDWQTLEKQLQQLAFQMIAQSKGTVTDVIWTQRKIGKKALRDGYDLGVLVHEGGNLRFYHQSLHGYFALPQLTKALKVNNRWERITKNPVNLIRQIGDLGEAGAPAVPALIAALADPEWFVRGNAAGILGEIGVAATPAVPALIAALHDPNNYVRSVASVALSRIGAAAVPALIAVLADPERLVRYNAVETLGRIGTAAAPAGPALFALLTDRDMDVRSAAAWVLARIGADVVPVLTAALRDLDMDVRYNAVEALGAIGVPAVPALIAALTDSEWFVRCKTAWALGKIGAAAAPAVPALIALLTDPEWFVQIEAAEALEKIRTPEALEAVKKWRESKAK